jgi:hypothetical protein
MRSSLATLLFFGMSCYLYAASPALTIYNQDFAVIRDLVPLSLKSGLNHVEYSGMTANAEPDSVILRDPVGKVTWQIIEQNYRKDAASVDRMLELYEGKTIQFQLQDGKTVSGRILRAQTRPATMQTNPYNAPAGLDRLQAMIELEGQIRFGLPGTPLFPTGTDQLLLKPTMAWTIRSDRQAALDAELGYVTGGLTWKADYNVVSADTDDRVDIIGWVTMENHSGKSFPEAQIALMAGDVSKKTTQTTTNRLMASSGTMAGIANPPVVTEKPFDDYHLYQLANRTTLLDSETKQVEFVRANSITTKRIYLYDGADLSRYTNVYAGYVGYEQIRNNSEYGTEMNPKVWVMREFVNSAANRLGIPLPKGRLRFYRQDTGGQLEFTGENEIDHTPKDETVRVFTGAAFDVAGSRKRTQYHNDFQRREADESFEISVRNRKAGPVAVTVREHLYRGANWNILSETDSHAQRDSNMIEFPIDVAASSEKIVRYSVHYTW